MEKIHANAPLPEILFASSDPEQSRIITQALKDKRIKKIAPRLYTSNLTDSPESIVKKHCYEILGERYPEAVLSHRTALEGGPSPEGTIVLTYKYTKNIQLPGLRVRLVKGPGPLEGDSPFLKGLHIASRPRAYLENLQPSRSRSGTPKNLPKKELETRLEQLCKIYGPEELNRLRDSAKKLAKPLAMESSYELLNKMVGALLGTRPEEAGKLSSKQARARAFGTPYDSDRLSLFSTLFQTLINTPFPKVADTVTTEEAWNHGAFFEAYFSNYIEGTEFEVNEAAEIIFKNKIMASRPADSHDILGTFQLLSNRTEITTTPHSPKAFLRLLQTRHTLLMEGRPEINPGEFKNHTNRAGSTVFVKPEYVRGTLEKAFEIYQALPEGFPRAAFIMFVVTEVHPFVDGNGRMARLMMTAELIASGESRIIIPTVYREDYLLALRKLTRQGDSGPYLTMLHRAQRFTASIQFHDYELALAQLRKCQAFLDPSEGKLQF